MTENNIALSLCIPTNGISKWVFPVLESIYSQGAALSLFEVIVTDNGDNKEFQEGMKEWEEKYSNLIYKKTDAKQFLNQIESFKIASGTLIKFVNHRMPLLDGTVKYLIDFSRKNADKKPGIYFLNGAIKKRPKAEVLHSFDSYIRRLSFYSSWSAGVCMWREDFWKIDQSMEFNRYFPHIDLILAQRGKKRYVIDSAPLFRTLPPDETAKGNYDLFFAFAVEYIYILLGLLRSGDIEVKTFLEIKAATGNFIALQYLEFVLMKKPCAYDVTGFDRYIDIFFSSKAIKMNAEFIRLKELAKRVIGK